MAWISARRGGSIPIRASWRRAVDIDAFVELIGGANGVAYEAVKTALEARDSGGHRQQGDARRARCRTCRARRKGMAWRSPSRARSGAAFPSSRRCAKVLAGNAVTRVCGHSQRHLQLHSFAYGGRRARRSRCALRRRKSLATPKPIRVLTSVGSTPPTSWRFSPRSLSARASTPMRFRSKASSTSRLPTSPPPMSSAIRIKLLGVAERTPHGVEQRVHPTMVAKSHPIAQTMGVLNAVTIEGDALGFADPGRPRGRGLRDRLRGRCRHRRYREGNRRPGVRPSGRQP